MSALSAHNHASFLNELLQTNCQGVKGAMARTVQLKLKKFGQIFSRLPFTDPSLSSYVLTILGHFKFILTSFVFIFLRKLLL